MCSYDFRHEIHLFRRNCDKIEGRTSSFLKEKRKEQVPEKGDTLKELTNKACFNLAASLLAL